MSEREVKQVIVIRRDLGMRRGKEIAQGAHASMAWLTERLARLDSWPPGLFTVHLTAAQRAWVTGSFTKVTCQAGSLEELEEIVGRACDKGVLVQVITDAGRTEFGGVPTVTALAVGPDWSDVVDQVTGHLKLY